jgi:quinoprotein glucose dehydrogenase
MTGKPVFPIEERPVPQTGGAPEDFLSPTQPYPTGIPSFSGRDFTEYDMWGITALDQLWCRIKFREARYDGDFTPPGVTPAIEYPGYAGGMEWGSATVDTSRGILVVNTSHVGNYTQLVPRAEAESFEIVKSENAELGGLYSGAKSAQLGTPYAVTMPPFMSPLRVPCNQPPYGRLHAMDLPTGKLLWSQPIGVARDSGPLGMRSHLPFRMGTPTVGGGVATQSGLYFIASTQDYFLRAFETATGKKLWQARLPTAGMATPMTYISPDSGRQFVVIAVGGGSTVGAPFSDHIMAFALPKNGK